MADGRHFVIIKVPYINEKLSNFDILMKFGVLKQIPIKMAASPKFKIFQFQNGGRPPFS